MTLFVCNRQAEVRALLARGHWPHACPAELTTHLDRCGACAELLTVTLAFQGARFSAVNQATLPSPGALWWRAQLRRRNAAIERVGKPMLGAYVFALAVVLLGFGLWAGTQAKQGMHWLLTFGQSATAAVHLDALAGNWWLSSAGMLGILIPVLASAAVLGAVVVYFSLERQ